MYESCGTKYGVCSTKGTHRLNVFAQEIRISVESCNLKPSCPFRRIGHMLYFRRHFEDVQGNQGVIENLRLNDLDSRDQFALAQQIKNLCSCRRIQVLDGDDSLCGFWK